MYTWWHPIARNFSNHQCNCPTQMSTKCIAHCHVMNLYFNRWRVHHVDSDIRMSYWRFRICLSGIWSSVDYLGTDLWKEPISVSSVFNHTPNSNGMQVHRVHILIHLASIISAKMFCTWTSHLFSLEHDKQKGRVEQYQNKSDHCLWTRLWSQENGQHFPLNTCHQWSTGRKN
jgi:hypothetical protein